MKTLHLLLLISGLLSVFVLAVTLVQFMSGSNVYQK
ncbi:rCG43283 [Rattus norvegicus]|uniref:RCG43283 n=1 Tax=Rattus norvegicus TaxID=10116 RepID=A6IW94_RAT|nr:rCG43283 [Rattus norvegicus]